MADCPYHKEICDVFAKNTVRTAENDASIKAEQHKVQRGGNKGYGFRRKRWDKTLHLAL